MKLTVTSAFENMLELQVSSGAKGLISQVRAVQRPGPAELVVPSDMILSGKPRLAQCRSVCCWYCNSVYMEVQCVV